MKPDKNTCLNCGTEISARAKYCSDKCRMAYTRKPEQNDNPNTNKPEQMVPEQPNPNKDTFRDTLTKTDKTFYDRAMRDFGEPYYKFGKEAHEETCLHCRAKFKTSLKMLRFCSYTHYSDAVGGKL